MERPKTEDYKYPVDYDIAIHKFCDYQAKQIKELKEEKQSILNAVARGDKLMHEINWDGKSEKEKDKQKIKELKEKLLEQCEGYESWPGAIGGKCMYCEGYEADH